MVGHLEKSRDMTSSTPTQTIKTSLPLKRNIRLNKSLFLSKELITVYFSGTPGNKKDWIGLYPESAPPTKKWLSWKYTDGALSGQLTFPAPSTPGFYNFRLFSNDGYTLLYTGPTFEVSP